MKKHILIVNQHGENRGDEAAMRAMLAGFEEGLDEVEFTLLYQFRNQSLRLDFDQKVEDISMVLPVFDYLRLLIFTILKMTGLDIPSVLSSQMQAIVGAYRKTDLVVSAPGGPYFGDIYVNHEIVHWWFIFLGHLYRKPIFLYATSAGPFQIKWMNVIRRWLYPKFTKLVVREDISANHIKELLVKETQVTVTADSAIQQDFSPYSRLKYFGDGHVLAHEKLLVAVSLNDYKYPESDNPKAQRANYDKELIAVLTYLAGKYAAHLMLFPQLYGGTHSDVSYLNKIASALPTSASWEIVDPSANSNMQRRLFAMCDIHLASRYHPAIFGNIAKVPGVCIYYEHKAQGFMSQLGLDKYAFDIREPDSSEICTAFDEIICSRDSLVHHLSEKVPGLRKRAKYTTKLALSLISPNR